LDRYIFDISTAARGSEGQRALQRHIS